MRLLFCFFFNPPATPSFSTLSLHDALPIWLYLFSGVLGGVVQALLGLIAPHFAGPMVGASAGICGLVAAFAILAPESEIYISFILPVRAKYLLPIMIVLPVVLLLTSSQMNVAHA